VNNLCCIIIPIYKETLNEYEITSLKQCCLILIKYSIIFVTHKMLNCNIYKNICDNYKINYKFEYFDKKYFTDISCYNALLLSKIFYKRFINYEYMLIYQLDAYVFRDELEYWCQKGYDYIGAPWLSLDNSRIMPVFNKSPVVGNGGFSLRKINKFIAMHSISLNILSLIHLFQYNYNKISLKSHNNIIYIIPRIIFRPFLNILKFLFFKYDESDNNEDVKWSCLFSKNGKVPSVSEAMKFSFESFPEYLYQLNNEELPFGCHDWYKYYNYLFYKKHIKHFVTENIR